MNFLFVLTLKIGLLSILDPLAASPKRRLKVLVYSPTLTWSHMQFMGTIADTLAEAGHDVHFMRLIPNNFTMVWPKELHKVQKIHDIHQTFAENSINIQQISLLNDPFDGKQFTTFLWQSRTWETFMNFSSNICKELTRNKEMIRLFEIEKFDVAISELYHICPFAMFHRIGAKTKVGAFAAPLFQMMAQRFGIPTFASYVQVTSPMPFWSRLINFYNAFYNWAYVYKMPIQYEEPIVRDAFGDDFPKMDEIARNISLILVNTYQFFEFPRPISNKVINVGGLVEMKQKQSDSNVSRLLDNAKSGAVFISFGSFTDTHRMPTKMKMAFLSAFAQFSDIQFIWKLDMLEDKTEVELFAKYRNVRPLKWADQKAILLHPKTRAFVTHCGLNSLTESVRAGVPVLAIPLFGDQKYNAILAHQKGVGIKLDVNALKGEGADEVFFASLDKILNDPFFRGNAQMVKRKFELAPFAPKDKLVRWIEFAAEFAQLNELNLPWDDKLGLLAFYSIDVLLFSIVSLAFVVFTVFKVAKILAKCLMTNERKVRQKEKIN